MNTNGHHKLVESLARIRGEWEEAADGVPLIAVEGSVGLILADLAESVGLDQQEMIEALGPLAELV